METLSLRGAPVFAPAARPGVGSTSPDAWELVAGPGEGLLRAVIPDLTGITIAGDDELVYDWLPVAGEGDARYAATAFAVELELDDGTTLVPVDQHGMALDPDAQAAAKTQWVDQWNRRMADITPAAGRTVTAAVAVLRRGAHPVRGFLDSVAIRPAAPRPATLLEWIDTRRGTHASDRFSRGNTAPLVTLPHGGVFAIPMTDASAGNWPYRWHAGHAGPRIQAFATSHIPSPWIGDRGVFQLMPSGLAAPDIDRLARALPFARASEQAGPHRYAVTLDGPAGPIEALVTAGDLAVGMRFRGARAVIVDHLGTVEAATWAQDADGIRIDARVHDRDDVPDHFVHVRLPAGTAHLMHADGRLSGHVAVEADVVDVLVGISTIDAAQARENLDAAGSVDDLLADAAARWHARLAVLEVPGADDVPVDVMRSIAGGLGRLFSYPNAHAEPGVGGPRYRSPVDGAVRPGEYSANNGFWDTYRTAWPLLALLTPETAGRLADGFVQHFADAGWVARWSAPGPVDSMTGTTSDTVFAELAEAGVGFRLEEAYRSARWHATVPAADPRVGRKGLRPGIFRGFIDTDTHEGMSWTLDNAINDASAARMARILALRTADPQERARLETEAGYFARRALGYRAVFHPDLGFFLGRRSDGSWRVAADAFDPAEWGHDYTETNAWGTAFTAPHDGAGLAALHGVAAGAVAGAEPGSDPAAAEAALGAKLDAFFATPETADPALAGSYGFVIHEQAEARDVRMGMLGLSNQPAHHIPLMHCFAGRHDDAHRIVVEARDRLFVGSELGQGYPGDEDNGEMSAWYLFAVLGLYPLVPASGELVLTPPLLPRVVLRPEGRDPLEITTENAGAPYIARVEIDGAEWTSISVPRAVLAGARRLHVVLSDEPRGWAADTRPSSASEVFGVDDPLRDLLAVRPGSPTDDTGDAPVALAAGESLETPLVEPAVVDLYTVTLAGDPEPLPAERRPVQAAWTLEGVTADGAVIPLDRRDEVFEAASQTRPFRPALAAPLAALRLTALTPLALTQLEAFGPA